MAEPVIWYDKFMFLVEIDGLVRAGFQTCDGLGVEAANIAYKEGARRHPHNSPGTITYGEVTLARGGAEDDELYNWFVDTYDPASGIGTDTPRIYRDFDIIQMDLTRTPVKRWAVKQAYCRSFVPGTWDADADEKVIETVIVQPDSFSRESV